MKIKKRLKYKSTLPKADYSMDPNALSNMNKQAAEETPAQGGGMGAGAALGIANGALDFATSFAPKDNNDGIGISHKGSAISKGITGGLHAGASIAKAAPGVGTIVGGVMDAAATIGDFITGMVDKVREKDRTKVSRLARKEYDPTQDNVGYSFGNSTTSVPTSQPMFGGQAKYGMPLFGNGGMHEYDDKGRQLYKNGGFLDKVDAVLSAPQRTATYAVEAGLHATGLRKEPAKYEDPSDAIGIDREKHPWLKLGTDVVLDPTNLLGVGLASKAGKLAKGYKVLKSTDNVIGDLDKGVKLIARIDKAAKASNDAAKLAKTVEKTTSGLNKINHTLPNLLLETKFHKAINLGAKDAKGAVAIINDLINQYPDKAEEIKQAYTSQVKNNTSQQSPSTIKSTTKQTSIINKKSINTKPSFENFYKTVNPDYNDTTTYNLREAYNNLPYNELKKWQQNPEINHLPDTYKLPTHPTFSNESKYYKEGMPAGKWEGENYIPINRNTKESVSPERLNFVKQPSTGEYTVYDNGKIIGTSKDKTINTLKREYALGGDPRSQSNIEAEQGEAMQHSSGKIENIEGQKHENGGTPLQVQPSHEYIYSDSLGYDREGNMTLDENLVRYSFADTAKKIERKYKGRENDSIVQKTKKLELGNLKQDAEQARVAKEEIEMGKQMKKYKAKYGANLKRFDNSGDPNAAPKIMTAEEMKAMYQGIQSQADAVSKGFAQTISDFQQTAKQMDENSKIAQGQTPYVQPVINKPLFDISSKVGNKDYFSEPTTLHTPQGTYDKDGNFKPSSFVTPTTSSSFIGPTAFSFKNNTSQGGIVVPGNDYQAQQSMTPMTPLPASKFNIPATTNTLGLSPVSFNKYNTKEQSLNLKPSKNTGFFGDLTTGDKIQLSSILPAFGFNMDMGLRKADVEPNRKNPYENEVLSMMANRKFDPQHYLNQANLATNTAKEDIGNNSTSVGVKRANLQKLYANQLGTLGDITTKGQEMNNQYRAEEANTKNIIGEANRAESIRAAGINDQNKARKQQFLAKAFEQLGQGIATTGQSANQSLTNKLLIKSLSEISPDFDVKNMKDMEVDNDGYIVFKGQKTEFKMSDEGKIVMASGTPNTANAAKSQYAPKEFTMKAFANFTKTKTKK